MRAAEIARQAVKEGWSVREMERRVAGASRKSARRRRKVALEPMAQALEEQLKDYFSTRVRIRQQTGTKGSIEVEYHGPDDFERIYELMTGEEVSRVSQ